MSTAMAPRPRRLIRYAIFTLSLVALPSPGAQDFERGIVSAPSAWAEKAVPPRGDALDKLKAQLQAKARSTPGEPPASVSQTPGKTPGKALGKTPGGARTRLHFMRYGKGPAVVFLHGLGSDSSIFIDELQKLEATHTVLLIDLPGHGLSKAAAQRVDLPTVARQIADLILAQRVGPAVVVGHSLGGTLAGYVALAEPRAVRGIVSIDAMFAPYPIPQEEIEKLRFQLAREPSRALREFYGPLAQNERQLDKIVAGAYRTTRQTLISYLEFVSERDDLRRHVSEIQVPVHVMATQLLTLGHSDAESVKAALMQVGYAGLTRLSYDYFPRAKHWIFWDEPEAFHASLERYLRRIDAELPIARAPAGALAKPAPPGKNRHPLTQAQR